MDAAKIKQLFNEYFINTLKNDYVNYQGRANRPMYWYFVLFNLIISIIISIIAGATGLHILSSLYSLALFCPGVCLGIRRMHDLGKTGWWILVPLYNIYLLCLKGEDKDNAYGKPVK